MRRLRSETANFLQQDSKLKEEFMKNNFIKDKNFFTPEKNLWENQNRFSSKQLAFYHQPSTEKQKIFKKKENEEKILQKTLDFNVKKYSIQMRRSSSKSSLQEKRKLRLELQVLSGQKCNFEKISQIKTAVSRVEKEGRSRQLYRKSDQKVGENSWDNHSNRVPKYLKMVYTKKVVQGEDIAMKMIASKIEDYKASSLMIETNKQNKAATIRNSWLGSHPSSRSKPRPISNMSLLRRSPRRVDIVLDSKEKEEYSNLLCRKIHKMTNFETDFLKQIGKESKYAHEKTKLVLAQRFAKRHDVGKKIIKSAYVQRRRDEAQFPKKESVDLFNEKIDTELNSSKVPLEYYS